MSRGKKILALIGLKDPLDEPAHNSPSSEDGKASQDESTPSKDPAVHLSSNSFLIKEDKGTKIKVLQNIILKSPHEDVLNYSGDCSYKFESENDPYEENEWTDIDEPFGSDHSEYLPNEASYSGSDNLEISPTILRKKDKKQENSDIVPCKHDEDISEYTSSDYKPFSEIKEPVVHSEEEALMKLDDVKKNDNNEINKKNKRTKAARLPDFCYFCETPVLNFARHLFRNHSYEPEVQKISALQAKDLVRKRMITAIRNRGNHLRNLDRCVKPIKKSHAPGRTSDECVPCKHCLGYFRPVQLWRHVKRCPQNPGEKTKFSHKSDAQDMLVRHLPVNLKLKETVFPRMLPDKISLVAKKDLLICQFGAQYIMSHRELHHVNVCSRKMRELARILIEIKKLHPSIRNLFDALQPIYFDSFVEATKQVAGYDASKEEYASATFAMNISKSLKECCSLAIRMTLKKKSYHSTTETAELEANFKTFQTLITDSWKFEVSSVAASCLNTRKWNKVTIVPLASDIKLFRSYLIETAQTSLKDLEIKPNNERAYKLLLEVSYCRSMLLNRKRGGELQRMPLDLYERVPSNQSYEEFSDAISPTERILLKKFKRVVIRGKRDRGVPVLFSTDVQEHLKLLISLRERFVKKENKYLFPKINHETPITGYKVMQKHAKLCGAKNPNAITSTRLRKHLATMSQIFELSPNDIEQLATFMGHTTDVHKQVYRLPDDIFQTAKIAKLLLLMESGKAGEYKGKSLDEIQLDLEENIAEEPPDEEIDEPLEQQVPQIAIANPIKKNKRVLVPWTCAQKELAKEFFKKHISECIPPKQKEIETLKLDNPGVFDNKSWQQIKVFIQNIYRKN